MASGKTRLQEWLLGPRLEWVALFALLVIAATVRLAEATRVPMWFDEIYTLRIARLGPAGIVHALRSDIHPPLHEWIVWAWWRMVGNNETALRSLSVIFGVGMVAATYFIARDLFGRAAALLAALLLALHRIHVYHSQELRAYAMLWLLYLLAMWAAWRFARDRRLVAAIGYALSCTAALYTHYQSILFIAFLGLWGLIALALPADAAVAPADAAVAAVPVAGRGRALLIWIAAHVVIVALFLPQLRTLLAQVVLNRESHWIQPPHFSDVIHMFQGFAFGYRVLIIPLTVIALIPLFRRREWRGASLLFVSSVPLVVLCYVMTQHGAHLFTERYMEFVLPSWCMLIAAGIMGLPWPALSAVMGIGLAVLAARSLTLHQAFGESREQSLAAQYLESRARPGDVVMAADTHSLLFLMEHEPSMARYRLLLEGGPLPYYEGTAVIPDSIVWHDADFMRWRDGGGRWYGMRTHHGGVDSRPALDSLRAHAAAIRHLGALVVVVEGQTDTTSATR